MGASCGCADDTEKQSELAVEQDEMNKRMQSAQSLPKVQLDEKTLKYLKQNEKSIVKI